MKRSHTMGKISLTITSRNLAHRCAAAILLAGALLSSLPGCAQRADGSTVTIFDDIDVLSMNAEGLDPISARQLDRVQRYAQMRVEAAGIGGAAGALAGILIGNETAGAEGAVAGGIGGAFAGAQLGYLAGAYFANLNSVAEDRRNDLNVQLAAAKAAVRENQQAVDDARTIVDAEERRIARLNSRRAAGELQQDQYREELEGLNTRLAILDESLRAAENDQKLVEKTIKGRGGEAQSGDLPRQRGQLASEVRQLEKLRAELIDVALSVPEEDRDAVDMELGA